MRRRAAALVSLALAAFAARAEPQPRWYVQVENDIFFDTDRWYSSGVRIARVAPARPVATEWGVLHEVYSPEAKHWVPGVDDRAPAARLLAYGARHTLAGDAFTTLELAMGVTGPSALGDQLTSAVHRVLHAAKVEWSRQEGDRFDIQAAAVRSQRWGDLQTHYGAVAGSTQVFAHGGLEWRFGAESTRAALSPAMRYAATPPPAAGEPGWGGFVGASARFVAMNALISRNYDPLGPELDPHRLVGRAAAGIACVRRWGSATLALVQESREFEAQRRPQAFGSLTVHVEF